MYSFAILISQAIDIYIFCLFAHIIMHWLIHFNIINPHQKLVGILSHFFYSITEPALRPIRRIMARLIPALRTLDISPIILILLLNFARNLMFELLV
jgi:YggT family protein